MVGVGSVGTRAWIALFFGRDHGDPLFLQMKEAEASVLEEFVGKSEFTNHGKRVVVGQRLMQATSDIFLGWLHVNEGMDGSRARLLRPATQGLEGLRGDRADGPDGMAAYGRLCGWTLARSHARSGDRVAIASYLGRGETLTTRSSSSRGLTPSRTSATTTRSTPPSNPAGSSP